MDLFEQFQETLTKNIGRAVEDWNKKRKLKAAYNRVFTWNGVYMITCFSDKTAMVSIHLKEESEEMYAEYGISFELPLKTLLDETLLEAYLKQ